MKLRIQDHPKIVTFDKTGRINGYLVPIYNVNDHFFEPGREPQQMYLSVISPGCSKGPHLHHIRTGFFTCIKGNLKIVLKIDNQYVEYDLGEDHQFLSLEIPTGVPALIQNLGNEDAFLLNMPNPAWTPELHDEFTEDFSDYEATKSK
jgi:dTDP-4-dehydrorhamnose 3,5-epimerase-like enzyme